MTLSMIRELIGDFLYRDKTPQDEVDITVEMTENMMVMFHQDMTKELEKAGFTIVVKDGQEDTEDGYKFSALKFPMGGTVRIIHNDNRFAIYKTKKDESQ